MDAIKVLLVDDEEAVLELARDWLESRAGFSVTAVDTAKKALEVLRGNHIDAVVSDFQMEGMDGIELLKAIRAEFGEIPFIFFTGKGREEVVIAAIESGADSYLQKGGAPLHQFTELTHRIKEAVKKRKAEQALFLKNMVFESALTGDSIADVDGTVREVNPTFLDLWGYASKDEVVGLNLEEFIYSKAELKEIIDMLGKEGRWEGHSTAVRKDGSHFKVHGQATPLRDDNGKIVGYHSAVWDMTQRDMLEAAQRQSERRYREIFENAVEGIYRSTPQGRYVSVNPAFARMMGYESPEDLIGSVTDIGEDLYLHREDRVRLGQLLKGSGSVQAFEVEGRTKDGRRIWVSINAHVIRGEDGEIEFYEGTQSDITEKKRAEQAQRESESKYRSLYESMTDAFVTVDMKGIMLDSNRAFREMVGYADEELRRMTFKQLTPEKWHSFEEKIVQEQVLRRGDSEVYEKEYRRKDGTIFPVELRTFLVRDGNEEPLHMWAIVRDISERDRTRKALEASEERFRQVAEVAGEFIWEIDLDGIYRYASPVVEDILGYRPEELVGKMHFYDLFTPESRQALKIAAMNMITRGHEIRSLENNSVHKDGRTVILVRNGLPVRNGQGHIIAYRGADKDITDRKRGEQALRQINKKLNLLNAITRHDALNQIAAIIGNVSLLEMKGLNTDQSEYVKRIDRSARAIQGQLEFTRVYQDIGMQDPSWQRLKDSVDKAQGALPLGALKMEIGDLEYLVWADPLLAKVIYNLIDNTLRHGEKATCTKITTEERNGRLVIAIEDDGVGISDADRAYLFVRGHGKNSGYGLFLTREVLAITDATIEECGVRGKGARFEITFPRFGWRRAPR